MKSPNYKEPSPEHPSTSYGKKLSGNQISRSRQGCMTCRTRRVKCDEKHPICGPCIRLQRECVWTRTWKFEDCTARVHSGYTKTGQSLPNALEASSRIWDRMIERRCIAQQNQNATSPSILDSDEYKATMCAPGTVNILVTSAEFARRPEYAAHRPSLRKSPQARSQEDRKMMDSFNDSRPRWSPLSAPGSLETCTDGRAWSSISYSTSYLAEPRRDSVGITPPFPRLDHEDQGMDLSGFAKLEVTAPKNSSLEIMSCRTSVHQRSSPPLPNPTAQYANIEDHISEDADNLFMLYERVVFRRIMPLAFKFGLNKDSDKNDILVLAARKFRPLRHAVCAITLLSLALQGRSELLEGAFHHYQQAISSVRLYSDNIHPDHLFYLHFILLLYDGYCKHRGWPHDPRILGQHIRHIFESFHRQRDPVKHPLQRHMLLNMLFVGIEASLAGDDESAAFIGQFKANWSQLSRSPHESIIYATPFDGVVAEVQDLRLRVYRFAADMSTVASGMRSQARAYRNAAKGFQETIDVLSTRLKKDSSAACLQYLIATDLETADCGVKGPEGEAVGCHSFDTAKVQYIGLKIYLHTSMYSGQRLDSARFAEETALDCFRIFTIISAIVQGDYVEVFPQLLGPLFMAGCVTKVPKERELAIELMKTITATSCMPTIADHVELLALVHEEQTRRESCLGGSADDVDWIDLALKKEKPLFGFCFM